MSRFVGWSAWVAQRGSEDVESPMEWLPLPGDDREPQKVDMDKIAQAFEQAKKWMQP